MRSLTPREMRDLDRYGQPQRRTTYEVQAQERDGVYGYVVTTCTGADSSWTCPWVAVPDATSYADAGAAGQVAVNAMRQILDAMG